MSEQSPVDLTRRVLWAHTSPLLADPEWIQGFRWLTEQLLSVARGMKRHENMPSYRDALLVRKWHPFLEGFSLHVMKVVDAGRNGPAIAAYVLDARVDEAFQLSCAMLDDMLVRKAANKDKVPIPLTTLEAINELLEAMHVPEAPQASLSDPGDGTSNPSPSSGEKHRGRVAGVCKVDLALTETSTRLKDGQSVTIASIANAVRCSPKNLERSKRFMRSYRELVDGMARVIRHQGTKADGITEAWVDPRGDQDEEDDGEF